MRTLQTPTTLPQTEIQKPRILVVEDEPVTAFDLQVRLEQMDYTVCGVATTAEEALAQAGKSVPDLVLMDIFLEGSMDGIDAAVAIRKRKDIPVIFLTLVRDAKVLERAKDAEPYGYLAKPANSIDLHSTIEMALYKARAEAERAHLLEELQKALAQVKQLSGFLPICSGCKKIRNDGGYWQQVEDYIEKHSEAVFSHGLCQECEKRFYSEILKKEAAHS